MQLLAALRKYGSGDVESISNELMRTPQEIADMIKRYKKIAHKQDNELFQEKAPIDLWTQIIFKNSHHNTLCPIARAFKYIEQFVAYGDNTKSSINVQDLYRMLSQLSEGIVPKTLDPKTSQFLKHLLKELAREVYDDDTKQAIDYLDNLSTKTFPKNNVDPSDPNERCEIILNPLKIPEDIYKSSS